MGWKIVMTVLFIAALVIVWTLWEPR